MKIGKAVSPPARKVGTKVVAPKSVKAAYSRPCLLVYGSVCQLTLGCSSMAGFDAFGMRRCMSDRRTKENIARIGCHPLGMGLYLFDYKPQYREQCGSGRQFGVMADEVEAIVPDAVSMGEDGFKRVDYGMLGIAHALQRRL